MVTERFRRWTLRPEGKAALDELARLAVTQYSKKLSERRASAMREYLIAQGIDAEKIFSSGVGESGPVVSCPGRRGKRLIACLQPDRSAQLTAVGPPSSAMPTLLRPAPYRALR